LHSNVGTSILVLFQHTLRKFYRKYLSLFCLNYIFDLQDGTLTVVVTPVVVATMVVAAVVVASVVVATAVVVAVVVSIHNYENRLIDNMKG